MGFLQSRRHGRALPHAAVEGTRVQSALGHREPLLLEGRIEEDPRESKKTPSLAIGPISHLWFSNFTDRDATANRILQALWGDRIRTGTRQLDSTDHRGPTLTPRTDLSGGRITLVT